MRLLGAVAAAAVLAGCGPVRSSWVRPDYEPGRTLRLVVVSAPLPEGGQPVGELFSLVARRYVNHHRDFIVKGNLAGEAVPEGICVEGVQGVLHLEPKTRKRDGGVEAVVDARLYRCSDSEEVWTAEAGGSWASDDPNLSDLTATYVEELGPTVAPYVPAVFHLLRHTLDTLPQTKLLTEEDVLEKIELGE